VVPDLLSEVGGSLCLASGLVIAGLQFRRLGVGLIYIVTIRRRRGVTTSVSVASHPLRQSRLRLVAVAQSGFFVRQALLTAALGLWLVTGWWPVLVVESAIIVWMITVLVGDQVSSRRSRSRPLASPGASSS
jgi:hypothetical protein